MFTEGINSSLRSVPSRRVGRRMMAVANVSVGWAWAAVGLNARLKAAATKSTFVDWMER